MKRLLSVAALGISFVLMTAFASVGCENTEIASAPVTETSNVAAEPAATVPTATEPAATEPAATVPTATEPAATVPVAAQPAAQPAAAQPVDYGRMIFVGDSRSVDLFSEPAEAIEGEVHDGITIYCRDGLRFDYLVESVNTHGIDNFDTLVSWMGCNDFGDFSRYDVYYDELLTKGKKLVLCTVGPTVDECLLHDEDYLYYPNANQIAYNNSLKAWAAERNIKVIDMYEYIKNSDTIIVDPFDGIHYYPVPNTEMWGYILQNLK